MFDQSFGNLDSSKNITTTAHDSLDSFELDFDFDEWINGTAALLHPFNESSSVAETAHSGHSSASDASVKNPDTDDSSPDGTAGAMRRINRFGRTYVCGRPLSINIRKAICELYQSGWKPCAIATALNVTHGCVSKIVKRYQTTGTVEARKIGGSHPRKSLPAVVNAIIKYKTEQPTLRTWELRDRLLTDGLCDSTTLPTTSSINRIIRQNLGRFFSRNHKRSNSTNGVNRNYCDNKNFSAGIGNCAFSDSAHSDETIIENIYEWNNDEETRSFDRADLSAGYCGQLLRLPSSVSESSVDSGFTPSPSLYDDCCSPSESDNSIANFLPEGQGDRSPYAHALQA